MPRWGLWGHDFEIQRDENIAGGSSIDAFTSDYPNCGLRIGVGHSNIGGYQFIRIVRYPKHGQPELSIHHRLAWKFNFHLCPFGISIISLILLENVYTIYIILQFQFPIFVENFNNCLVTYSFDSLHRELKINSFNYFILRNFHFPWKRWWLHNVEELWI